MRRLAVGALVAILCLCTNQSFGKDPPKYVTKWLFRLASSDGKISQSHDSKTKGAIQLPPDVKWKCNKVEEKLPDGQVAAGFDCKHENGAWVMARATCATDEEDFDSAKVAIGDEKNFVVIIAACQTLTNEEHKDAANKPIEQSL